MASVASYLHQNLSQSCHSIKIIYIICLFFSNFSRQNAAVHLKVRHKTELFPDQTGPDLVGVTAAALVLAGAAIADWLKKWRRQRRSGGFQPIRDKPLRWGVTNRVVSATFQGDNYRYRFFSFMHSVQWGFQLSLTIIVSLIGDWRNCQFVWWKIWKCRGLKNLPNCSQYMKIMDTFQGDNYRSRFFFLFMHSVPWARVVINSNCLINGRLKNLSNCT